MFAEPKRTTIARPKPLKNFHTPSALSAGRKVDAALMFKHLSYRTKLLLWILPILVAGLVTLSLSSYWYLHSVIDRELTTSTLASTGKSAETIEHWLGMILLEPETIAATPAALAINDNFALIDNQNIYRYKLLHKKYSEMFLDIYAADRAGHYHTVTSDADGRFSFFRGDISDRGYFRSIMAGGPSQITQPLVSRTFGVPTIFVVAPIKDDQNQPLGLVGAGISLDYVRKIAESLTLGRTGYGFIIARDGTFIYHPNHDWVMKKRIGEIQDPSVLALGRAMLGGGSGSLRYTYEGVEKIAFYKPIPLAGWSVATTVPVKELFAPATQMLKYYVLVTTLLTLLITGTIILASGHMTRPLLKLASHAARIGGGERLLEEVDVRSDDEVGTLAKTFNAMTERLNHTLDTLSLSERQYRTLVDNLNIGIFRIKLEPFGEWVQVNPAMLAMFNPEGMQEFLESGLADRFQYAEQRNEVIARILQHGAIRDMEVTLRRVDGKQMECHLVASAQEDANGRVNWIDGVLEDISERRRLEEQLRQSQKMEAIGNLAGGIAHDFNNLLTAIIGYTNLSSELASGGSTLKGFLDKILEASQDAAKLTRGLLTMSRKQVVALMPIDLNATVRKVDDLMTRIIGEDIEFKISYCRNPLIIRGDASQMEQVLMNLLANARDAMPGGGQVSLATELIEIQAGNTFLPSEPGKYALISISDTGQGMDEATRQRIFEPFFTTKEIGKGTGLGLSIAYGIIKQHQGEINVYSEPGHGTTFRIYFKCIDFALAQPVPVAFAAPTTGNEMILLAEDDARVRDVYRSVLQGAGYTVIDAGDGLEAVALFKQHQGQVNLLLFDLVMPKLNGKEAFESIRALAPEIKVLFSSGYTREILSDRNLDEEGVNFLSKPATPVVLLDRVRAILDGRAATRM